MPVSKRTRFEVLRRDGHRCRYCGAGAGDSGLTVDHVLPVALGGGDGPDNLVAACRDCNSGKTSTSPDSPLVAQVSDDAIRWAAARKAASEAMAAEVQHRTAYRDGFLDAWNEWGSFVYKSLPSDWPISVTRWQEQGLPLVALVEAVDIAMGAKVPRERVFVYMCGVVKRRLSELDATTAAEVSPGPEPASTEPHECGFMDYAYADEGHRLLSDVVDFGYQSAVDSLMEFGPTHYAWAA